MRQMPEKSGTDAPLGAADAGAAATAASATAMHGICLSFIAAPYRVRIKSTLFSASFLCCFHDKVGQSIQAQTRYAVKPLEEADYDRRWRVLLKTRTQASQEFRLQIFSKRNS